MFNLKLHSAVRNIIRSNFPCLILFAFYVNFCSVKQKELSQIESKYSIDLDGVKETSIPFSAYFKSPKTIILETNENCLIGHIFDLQVFDECIYVLDTQIANSLFVFDMSGQFLKKIGSLGQGPGEYIQLSDFTLDKENKNIYLLDFSKRIHQYRLDGSFVRTITLKLQKTNIRNIHYYNNRLLMSVLAFNPAPSDYMLLETDLNNEEILKQSLSLKYNKGWGESIFLHHSFFVSRSDVKPLYTQMFMDYIVTIGEDITPYITLKSKNLVTEKDIGNISNFPGGDTREALGRFRNYFSERSKIFDVHSFVENDEFILFRYQQGLNNYYTVIFHKNNGFVKLTNQFNNDLKFKKSENRFFDGFMFSDSKGGYEVMQTRSIENFQESIRNNDIVPDLDKLDELLKLEADSNPVIFYYEFK